MKLATYRNGTRDGQLMLVSKDLTRALPAGAVAPTLQAALDDWEAASPRLEELAKQLEDGRADGVVDFDPTCCEAPLPRAYQWADGSAYVNHVELVRRARNAEMPPSFWTDPLMYQGGSDELLGPTEDIVLPSEEHGIDFEAEVTVVTGDVPMGVSPQEAGRYIRLVMLVNDVSLRGLIPGELGKGFGFFQSKPSSSFSPVAVTPDELGDAWDGGKVNLPLLSYYNGKAFGKPNAGEDMTFEFPRLIAHAARTRRLGAGTVIGSGTVSNTQGTDHGTSIEGGGVGYSCIAEVRMIETIRDGAPSTGFMRFGDRVRIEMLDGDGRSIFGAIDQRVVQLGAAG